jgi:hypothetical protein
VSRFAGDNEVNEGNKSRPDAMTETVDSDDCSNRDDEEVSFVEEKDINATLCDVCGDDASWEDNPILLCDGCDVAVHTSCYGVKVRSTPQLDIVGYPLKKRNLTGHSRGRVVLRLLRRWS